MSSKDWVIDVREGYGIYGETVSLRDENGQFIDITDMSITLFLKRQQLEFSEADEFWTKLAPSGDIVYPTTWELSIESVDLEPLQMGVRGFEVLITLPGGKLVCAIPGRFDKRKGDPQ
jgi:hypothetical protein